MSCNLSLSAPFAASLFCWYVFTLVSAVYTKKYLNETYDSFTFTLVALAYGAFFKLLVLLVYARQRLNLNNLRQEVHSYSSLAFFNVASLLLTNIAINETSVAFIYMIKASEPIFVLLLSYVLQGETQSGRVAACLVPICLGVSLTIIGNVSFSFYGLSAVFFGNLATASRSIFIKTRISPTLTTSSSAQETLAPNSSDTSNVDTLKSPLHFYLSISFVSFVLFVPIYLVKMLFLAQNLTNEEIAWPYSFSRSMSSSALGFLFVGTVSTFLYNYFSLNVLKNLSPITHSVINIMKRMLVVVVSLFAFTSTTITSTQMVGVCMADLGVLAYSYFKLRTSKSNSITVEVSVSRKRAIKQLLVATIAMVISVSLVHGSPPFNTLAIQSNSKRIDYAETMRLECLRSIKEEIVDSFRTIVKPGSDVFLFDLPSHQNYGDTLIWLGEMELIKELGLNVKVALTDAQFNSFNKTVLRQLIKPNVTILLHGGGNFGDLYRYHSARRNTVVSMFGTNRIVFMPQTINYRFNKSLVTHDARLFANHSQLVITTRSDESYEFAMRHFGPLGSSPGRHRADVRLVSDMAFMLGAQKSLDEPLYDVLVLKRTDSESKFSSGWKQAFLDLLSFRYSYLEVDWFFYVESKWNVTSASAQLLKTVSERRLNLVNRIISQGRVVITDRLHASIFSLLIGRPHIIVDEKYKKIENTRKTAFRGKSACRDEYLQAFQAVSPAHAVQHAVKLLSRMRT